MTETKNNLQFNQYPNAVLILNEYLDNGMYHHFSTERTAYSGKNLPLNAVDLA